MLIVVCIMITGVFLGWRLRGKPLLRLTGKIITWAIYLLLFVLGLSVGSDEQIISSLGMLGWEAVVITLGAILGSITVAKLIHRWLFNQKGEQP